MTELCNFPQCRLVGIWNFYVDGEDVIEFASHRIICDAIFLHIIHIDSQENPNALVQEYFNTSKDIDEKSPYFTPDT